MSLSLTPLSIFYIEFMRQTRGSTEPFLLVVASTFLTAAVGGLRFGLACAALTSGYIAFATSISFGPIPLTSSVGAAGVAIGVLCFTTWIIGRTRDQNSHLVTSLRAAGEDLEEEVGRRTSSLVASNTRLVRSETRYRALVENAPWAILVLDVDERRFVDVNRHAEALFGLGRDELLSVDAEALALPGTLLDEPFAEIVRRLLNDRSEREREEWDFMFETGGKRRVLQLRSARVKDLAGNIVQLSIEEVTEAKDRLDELRKYQQMVESTNDLMALIDSDYRYVAANKRYRQFSGKSGRELIGRTVGDVLGTEFFENVSKPLFDRAFAGESTDIRTWVDSSHRGARFLDVGYDPLRDDEGEICGAVVSIRDITERHAVEQALEESNRRIRVVAQRWLDAQEVERRRIARELHDEIGQSLTAVKIMMSSASPAPAKDGVQLVDSLINTVRALSLDLRPSLLDDFGLMPALKSHLNRQSVRSGIDMNFESVGEIGRFSAEIETACYRVAQEALTNVIRHARAQHVAVKLTHDHGVLRLLVRDDGVGFDVCSYTGLESRESFGLLGMRERVELVGGEIEIESAPGSGTEVRARFPLPETAATVEEGNEAKTHALG